MNRSADPSFWRATSVAVTGGAGFLGQAVVRQLAEVGAELRVIRSAEHDLRDAAACREAIGGATIVMHLAARVGGIDYNRRNPAPLAYDNLEMGANVFEQSRLAGVEKLVGACSVCAYPHHTPVPFREEEIWAGYPEPSNAPYGLAKRMLLVLSDAYRRQYGFDSCMPVIANLYGPNDNYDLEDSHVVAAMVRRYIEAVEHGDDYVTNWGSGSPTREFLYVDDAALALILAAERLETSEPVNVGTGTATSIRELAQIVAELTGFEGETAWDSTRPDGQPSRYLDVSRARELFGFQAKVELKEGLGETIAAYRNKAVPAAPRS